MSPEDIVCSRCMQMPEVGTAKAKLVTQETEFLQVPKGMCWWGQACFWSHVSCVTVKAPRGMDIRAAHLLSTHL